MLVSRCCKSLLIPSIDYYICDVCNKPTSGVELKNLKDEKKQNAQILPGIIF